MTLQNCVNSAGIFKNIFQQDVSDHQCSCSLDQSILTRFECRSFREATNNRQNITNNLFRRIHNDIH